ncbi:MAG TPA: hypothetical protein VHX86_05085 [Tepidisphaeraceae bacterium]|nr:hypothetical protein [Tepidisphaeraceae bacterium]
MAEKEESTLDTILHLKRKEPFSPFRIVMASGDRYVIENPDALAIASTQLHYYPRSGMGIHMRLNQIAAVEEPGEKPAA